MWERGSKGKKVAMAKNTHLRDCGSSGTPVSDMVLDLLGLEDDDDESCVVEVLETDTQCQVILSR